MFKKILSNVMVGTVLLSALSLSTFAEEGTDVAGSENFDALNFVVDEKDTPREETAAEKEFAAKVVDRTTDDVCGFFLPEEKTYGAQLITVRRQLRVEKGETFKVKVFMKNTGSMPWFSNSSTCLGPKMSLGTDKDRDRASDFYNQALGGWEGNNRIAMDQFRTDPGEIASFTFEGKAPNRDTVYKEYFAPVLKEIEWIDDAVFDFEIIIGDGGANASDVRKKMQYSDRSGSLDYLDLNAEKILNVDLSEQMLYVKLGDSVVKKFRVSTGAAATPTPTGTTYIKLKQQVRIGSKPPHYIMPKFMWFREGGYGFHALPSLGRVGGGEFWTEARNHIGIPVSHGCVRVLSEDAAWLFDFADVGTKVVVQY